MVGEAEVGGGAYIAEVCGLSPLVGLEGTLTRQVRAPGRGFPTSVRTGSYERQELAGLPVSGCPRKPDHD